MWIRQFSYSCQKCGLNAISYHYIPKCLHCEKTLCKRCYIKGLCSDCDKLLLPIEKKVLRKELKLSRYGCYYCIGLPLLIVLSLTGIGLALSPFVGYWIMTILNIGLYVSIPLSCLLFYVNRVRTKNLISQFRIGINQRLTNKTQSEIDRYYEQSNRKQSINDITLDNSAYCGNCGNKLLPGFQFCLNCKMEINNRRFNNNQFKKERGLSNIKICKNCGNRLPPGAQFCLNCESDIDY